MLGWRLWRQISRYTAHILENPIHRRIVGQAAPPLPFMLECAMLFLVPVIMLPAIVFTSAVYGVRWATLISQSIAREQVTVAREQVTGRFDLLALTPNGSFGSAWVMACGAVQRTGMLYVLETPFSWLLRGFLMLIVFTSVAIFSLDVTFNNQTDAIIISLYTFAILMCALLIDHVHSVGLSVMIGLLAPTYTTRTADAGLRTADAGLLALTVYSMLQLTTYAVVGLFGFAVLPDLLVALLVSPMIRTLLLPIVRVVLLFTVRELVVIYLWTLVQQQYHAEKQDVNAVDLPATTVRIG